MATLKKKNVVEEIPVEETNVVEDNPYMNEEEKEVIEFDGEQYVEDSTKVSSEKMNKVLDLLQEKFNLKDKGFELTGYADKGNKIIATLSNLDYEATFTLKSQETIMMLSMH